MHEFSIGDIVTFGDRRGHANFNHFAVGSAYVVVDYDHNDTAWPDGCSGQPFVTVLNDNGVYCTLLASRFDRINKDIKQ